MKLNPKKCIFDIKSGKFLGFMISTRGIEANPDKVQAVLDMRLLRAIKDVQWLAGHMAAIRRLMSKFVDKCQSFFSSLKMPAIFKWDEEADVAFQSLKDYLSHFPKIACPTVGKHLLLYLAMFDQAASVLNHLHVLFSSLFFIMTPFDVFGFYRH